MGYLLIFNGCVCVKIDIMYFGKNWILFVLVVVFVGLGVIIIVFVIFVLIKFDKILLVKVCGWEFFYFLLIGIFMVFSIIFVIVLKFWDVICIVRFFGYGVVFMICYVFFFIKMNRILRIFNWKNFVWRFILILLVL